MYSFSMRTEQLGYSIQPLKSAQIFYKTNIAERFTHHQIKRLIGCLRISRKDKRDLLFIQLFSLICFTAGKKNLYFI